MRVVTYSNEQQLPVCALGLVLPVTSTRWPWVHYGSELFGLTVQQSAGTFALQANDRLFGRKASDVGHPCPGQHPTDHYTRRAHRRRDLGYATRCCNRAPVCIGELPN